MNQIVFIILLVIGTIGFFIVNEHQLPRAAGYFFVYFAIVFEIRQWYWRRKHKLPWWYFWDPRNIFDQFKKP
jgi:hypothetical protein